MKKLYKIWQISDRWSYPLVDVITATIYYRDEVVSIDLPKLQRLCNYLNRIADDNVHYEVRQDVDVGSLV